MTEYARLVVAVDSSQVKRSTGDLRRFADESGRTERRAASMVGTIRAAASAFGALKLTQLIKEAAMANSRFDQLGLVMETVGRNVGISSDEVNRYAKEVEAMGISLTESRQTVIRMIQAQMDLTKASELARLAQDAAVIANTNSSDALGRLIYGLQSGQVEILRNMGLNVQFERSYRQLADQMGITVDQLSEADRAQARVNAAMQAGVQIAGSYEASMDSASKQLGSTTRYLQDIGVMSGEVFSDATRDLVFGYSDALKEVHSSMKAMSEDGTLKQWSEQISTAISVLSDLGNVGGLADRSQKELEIYSRVGTAWLNLQGSLIQEWRRRTGMFGNDIELIESQIARVEKRLEGTTTSSLRNQDNRRQLAALIERRDALLALQEAQSEDDGLLTQLNETSLAIARQYRETTQLGAGTEELRGEIDKAVFALDEEIRALREGERAAFAHKVANDELAMARFDDLVALREQVAAERELQSSYDQTHSRLHRQANLAEDATHAEQLLYEIQYGRLKGIADQQRILLEGLADELDHKRELTEQERQRIEILRESGQLRAANDAQWQLEYAERIAEYERQGNEEAIKRLETLRKIREIQLQSELAPGTVEGVSRAPSSSGVDAMFGGATGELLKLQEQAVELESWRATELERQQGFLEAKAINEEVYTERVRNIHQQHQAELSRLEQARSQVSLAASEQMFGSLTSMAATFAGEQSDIYRAMFAVQKAAAIAQSIVAIQQGIAMAAANPWPANLGAMASVAAATAGIVSNIASVQSFEGGGYTGNAPRVGGLDGKGGFMAMVHPRETIIDHTKQRGGPSGGVPPVSFTAHVVVEGQPGMSAEESRAQGEMAAGVMRATFMSMIEKEARPGGMLWSLYGGGR